jgi:hypothetical protein
MSKKLDLLNKKLQIRVKLAQAKAAKALAQAIPEVIKLRTRQEGEGVNGTLKSLKDSSIKNRKRYRSDLHPDTTPETSNLTGTGQLLDAIQGKSAGSKVTVDIKKGKRKGELYGGRSTSTNKEVRKYVEDAGREFLQLSKDERQEAEDLAKEIILEEIRSVFNS